MDKENLNSEYTAPENSEKAPKKKLRGYALVRVIMMSLFGLAFAVSAVISVMYLVRNIRANQSYDQVMGDFAGITNGGEAPTNTNPIIISPTTPAQTTAGDSDATTPEATPPETEPVDEEYLAYVAACIAEAKKLQAEYPDFRGIVIIEGDTINLKYPILQSNDNQYYVGHLIDGAENSTGEIFLDYRNGRNFLANRNSVLYGHNMNDGTKFGQLKHYKKNNAFYTHNITVVTTEEVLIFKPFSFYKTTIYEDYTRVSFANDADFAEFCRSEQERSMFESNLEFTGGERIITLSTCYGTSDTERYCLHAVLVNITK